jgi:hypothetical protein
MSNNFKQFESNYDSSESNYKLILPLWKEEKIHNNISPNQTSSPFYEQAQYSSNNLPVRMDPINYNMCAPSLPNGSVRSFFKIDNPQDYARIVGKHFSRANLFASFCEKANVTNLPNCRNILMITTTDYPTLQWLENKLFENLKNKLTVDQKFLSSKKNIHNEKNKIYFYCNIINAISSIEDVTIYFKKFGKINKVCIPIDKETNRFRNYGWITFDKSNEATNAVKSNTIPYITVEFARN